MTSSRERLPNSTKLPQCLKGWGHWKYSTGTIPYHYWAPLLLSFPLFPLFSLVLFSSRFRSFPSFFLPFSFLHPTLIFHLISSSIPATVLYSLITLLYLSFNFHLLLLNKLIFFIFYCLCTLIDSLLLFSISLARAQVLSQPPWHLRKIATAAFQYVSLLLRPPSTAPAASHSR